MKTFKEYLFESKYELKTVFKPELKDEYEIADHIDQHSPSYVDREYMHDYFRGAKAVLKKTPVTEIKFGDADHNRRDSKKQKKYDMMPHYKQPPIVVQDGKVEDGHHRLRSAIKQGATHVMAYHVVDRNVFESIIQTFDAPSGAWPTMPAHRMHKATKNMKTGEIKVSSGGVHPQFPGEEHHSQRGFRDPKTSFFYPDDHRAFTHGGL